MVTNGALPISCAGSAMMCHPPPSLQHASSRFSTLRVWHLASMPAGLSTCLDRLHPATQLQRPELRKRLKDLLLVPKIFQSPCALLEKLGLEQGAASRKCTL